MRFFAIILTFISTAALSQGGSLYSPFGVNGQCSIDIDDLDDLTVLLKDDFGNTYFCGSTSENLIGTYPFDVCIGKLTPSGELDLSFGNNGIFRSDFPNHTISSLKGACLNENGIYFIGNAVNENQLDSSDFFVGKINLDGQIDVNFANNGFFTSQLLGAYNTPGNVLIDSEERLVFCGSTTEETTTYVEYPFIGRLTANGTLDTTFGTTGIVIWDYYEGNLVNGISVLNSQDRHGEGAYANEIIEINNNYFIAGKFVGTAFEQLHIWSMTKEGELNPNFVSQGPYIYQLDPGYNHLPTNMVYDGQSIYLSIVTDGSFYNGKQLIQKIDTSGTLLDLHSFEHMNYDSQSLFLKNWNGELYVGGYSKESTNTTPGHHSDQFLLYALDTSFNIMSDFGQDGYFESELSWGDEELGAEDFIIHDGFGVIGGYHNNLIGNNITDFVFMGVNMDENLENYNLDNSTFQIFPNPASSLITIEHSAPIQSIEILSLDGRRIQFYEPNTSSFSIQFENLSPGGYYIVLKSQENTYSERLIKY
ncbi:MAG: T9SS type A sorting domain-containing protein [Crocinitomicaceae bacterium]